jgi:hypothetical protein
MGAGIARKLGDGFSISARSRYGFADERVKARGSISYRRANGAGFDVSAYDDYAEAGDSRETSQLASSIAAQEFGTDLSDPFGARGVSVGLRTRPVAGWSVSIEGAVESQRSLDIHATPTMGTFEPTLAASPARERRATLSFDRPTRLGPLGFETQLHAEMSLIQFREPERDYRNMSRFSVRGNFERPTGSSRILFRSSAAWTAGGGVIPAQHLVFIGGPTSAPGYVFHQFAGRAGATGRAELQFSVPFASFSLGRYGRTPSAITLAPYANAAWTDRAVQARSPVNPLAQVAPGKSGWHPSLGIGALTLFDLLRFDVARGLNDGRWSFSVDVTRDLWSIL